MAPRTISLTFPIDPVSWARPRLTLRSNKVHGYKTAKNENFERAIAFHCLTQIRGGPIEGPLKLTVTFIIERGSTVKRDLPCVRPDLSNLLKILEDSLNEKAWLDDAQLVLIHASKEYGPKGCILVHVEQII